MNAQHGDEVFFGMSWPSVIGWKSLMEKLQEWN